MSDAIKTGSMRELQSITRPRTQSIGKRRKIEKSKGEVKRSAVDEVELDPRDNVELGTKDDVKLHPDDEVELGRFTGKTREETKPKRESKGRRPEQAEVVGPKRRKVDSDDAKAKRRRASAELEIASTRDISDDTEPSRPRAKKRQRRAAEATESWIGFGALVILSVLLVAATAATFLLMPRYDFLGDPLVADPAFEAGFVDWTTEGLVSKDSDDPARITLESITAEGRTYLVREIGLPPGDSLLILRAQVQGDNVVTGSEPWEGARIYLAQLGANGQPNWEEDHELFNLNGTTAVRNYRQAFTIPAEVETMRLGIEMKNATGRLTVSQLELRAAEYKTTFMVTVGCLLLAWSVLVIYTGIRTFKGIESAKIRLWLGIVCALSIVGLMLPGGAHDIGAAGIAAWLGTNDVGVDAIGHGVIFIALAFLVRLGRPSDPLWLHAGTWSLIAIASEVLQLFAVGREPSLDDLWVDGLGIILGLTLAEITLRMRRSPLA